MSLIDGDQQGLDAGEWTLQRVANTRMTGGIKNTEPLQLLRGQRHSIPSLRAILISKVPSTSANLND